MKALVLEDYNKFIFQDITMPKIANGDDVLIKVKAASVCGSDVHGMSGATGRRLPPIIMGHEASGQIVEVGSNVKKFNVGDRVVFNSTLFCGQCGYCQHGEVNLCDERKVFGVSCEEYKINGAYAEYIVVPDRIVYSIPESVSYEQASLIEPFSVGFHAVRVAELGLADTVLVYGSGTIGSFIIQSLRIKGAGKIIATDIDDDKLVLAKEMGADYVINSKKTDLISEIRKIAPNGLDIVFDVVGKASVARQGLDLLKKGGTIVMVGLMDREISFPVQRITTWQLRIQGTYISSDEYPACIDLISSGRVNLKPFLKNYVPLSEAPIWFNRLQSAEKGLHKVIFNPEK
jgi:2-desacetyl-2-hydroxyethyl bacteriochlorophyllide A dehydrogenase